MQLKAPMLAAVVAFAAVSTPAHASLLHVDPPIGSFQKLFEFEIKAKQPQPGRTNGEIEGKAKWEFKDPITGRESKREQKLKLEGLAAVPATLPFVFSAAPLAGGGVQLDVRFGDRSVPPLRLTADEAGRVPLRLVELEVEAKSNTEDFARPANAFAEALGFNGAGFGERIEATAPSIKIEDGETEIEDEGKTKRFFALAGGDPIALPFALSGTAGAGGDWKEFKVKAKFGNASFAAPPRPEPPAQPRPGLGDPIAVSEPGALAAMLAGLLGVGAIRRRRVLA